ncbi:hypothetical protein PVK06_009395 [Gossypium arboreum]|uniref:Uncharacterized protein n=1 Tax=Gossypium arboreum TaxID=29729 RepID=A0ABR0QMP1_GOSAR|nr:hypothetical protein PVK06_009395 [Gossypium arboreum]
MCLTFNRDNVQELLDFQTNKLKERNDPLETMVMALKDEIMATTKALNTRIEKLEGKLALCQAAVEKGVSSVALSYEDVPKLEEFIGTRFACDSVIELDDGANKEPKKLGSSKGKAKAKREKRSKKKRVKYFLFRGPHELQNYLKQSKSVMVKEKVTSELVESSKGLPHEEDVSLLSNLREKFVMKIVKLGPMRLNSNKATELAKSFGEAFTHGRSEFSIEFRERSCNANLKARINEVHSQHSDSVLHSNLLTWQERRGPFKVFEQGGRETVGKAKPNIVNQEDFVRGKLEFSFGIVCFRYTNWCLGRVLKESLLE